MTKMSISVNFLAISISGRISKFLVVRLSSADLPGLECNLASINLKPLLSKSAKTCLTEIQNGEKLSNPKIWKTHTFKEQVKGDIKVWFPTCPTDPTTPLYDRPVEEIKNELITSKELPPAQFPSLVTLMKNTEPDLRKVFRLVPL